MTKYYNFYTDYYINYSYYVDRWSIDLSDPSNKSIIKHVKNENEYFDEDLERSQMDDTKLDEINGTNGNSIIAGIVPDHWTPPYLEGTKGTSGADFFVLKPGQGNQFIDYVDGIDQFILLGGLQFNDLTIVEDTNFTQIQITGTNEVLASLISVNADSLDANDFIVDNFLGIDF